MSTKDKNPVKKKAAKKKPPAPEIVVLRDKVSQANSLIQARRNFTAIGMRIFFLGLQTLNPHFSDKDQFFNEKFPEVTLSPTQLTDIFGGNTWYLNDLKQECKRLFNAIIEFTAADGGFTLNHIFRELEYVPEEGLHIQFDDVMRPYLLDLLKANGYTVISVAQIFKLSSAYAVRLVEIMLQYQNLPGAKSRKVIERKMLMAELRFALNVKAEAYAEHISHFRKYVLDGPISEINARTVYRMSYEVVRDGKRGGRVIGFTFFMDVSAVKDDKPLIDAGTAVGRLQEFGFSESAAEAILAKCESESDCMNRIFNAVQSLKAQKKRGAVDNELGYLRRHIEENWSPPSNPTVIAVLAKPKAKKPASPRKGEPTPLKEIFQTLGAIAPQTPPAPRRAAFEPKRVSTPRPALEALHEPPEGEFRHGEKPVSAGIARLVAETLATGESLESVTLILALSGLTIERFRELYM